jgi:MerR family redox-sensitive transcriptional activator SoxR
VGDELTSGELSDRSGVATSALRFYEAQGRLRAHRTSGNQRRYDRGTLRTVALIQAGRAAGIPLEEILQAPRHPVPPGPLGWSAARQRALSDRATGASADGL